MAELFHTIVLTPLFLAVNKLFVCFFLLLQDIDEAEIPNYEQNVSDVLALIPSLPKGLDVNIHFTGCVFCVFCVFI